MPLPERLKAVIAFLIDLFTPARRYNLSDRADLEHYLMDKYGSR